MAQSIGMNALISTSSQKKQSGCEEGDMSTDVTRRKNEDSPLQRPLVGREIHSKPKRKSVCRGGDT